MPQRIGAKQKPHRGRRYSSVLAFSVPCVLSVVGLSAYSGKQAPVALPQPAPVVAQFDMVRLPVPLNRVSAGAKLRSVEFTYVGFPKHQVPEGAISDLAPYLDSVATSPLPANLPIFRSNLSLTGGAVNAVVEKIPEGMRAITLKVDATSAVEGWAAAGATVDVLLVTKESTKVVAEKVKILSAERSVTPSEGSPEVPSTVTLLTTQDQCLAINTAANLGKITFALRSLADEGVWSTTSYGSSNLKAGPERTEKNKVSAYVKAGGERGQGYALVDGKWVKSDVRPQGFISVE